MGKWHPHLVLRTVEKISYARFVATDSVLLNEYFDLLEDTSPIMVLLTAPPKSLTVMRLECH